MTVIILLSLASTSIIGTLLPQNADPGRYLLAYGEFLFGLFNVLDFFDMYNSWWFQFMIFLLVINILVCSIDRLSATWKIIFVKAPDFRISRFRDLSDRAEFVVRHTPEQGQKDVRKNGLQGF